MGIIKVWHSQLSMRGHVYPEFLELFSLAIFLVNNNLLTDSFGYHVWHHFTKNLLITFLGITGLAPDPEKSFTPLKERDGYLLQQSSRCSAPISVADTSKVSFVLHVSWVTRVTALEILQMSLFPLLSTKRPIKMMGPIISSWIWTPYDHQNEGPSLQAMPVPMGPPVTQSFFPSKQLSKMKTQSTSLKNVSSRQK